MLPPDAYIYCKLSVLLSARLTAVALYLNRDRKEPGAYAATARTGDDSEGYHPVYSSNSPFSSAQRAWSNICRLQLHRLKEFGN